MPRINCTSYHVMTHQQRGVVSGLDDLFLVVEVGDEQLEVIRVPAEGDHLERDGKRLLWSSRHKAMLSALPEEVLQHGIARLARRWRLDPELVSGLAEAGGGSKLRRLAKGRR